MPGEQRKEIRGYYIWCVAKDARRVAVIAVCQTNCCSNHPNFLRLVGFGILESVQSHIQAKNVRQYKQQGEFWAEYRQKTLLICWEICSCRANIDRVTCRRFRIT